MTNADKIRAMTNPELAEFIGGIEANECTGETYIDIYRIKGFKTMEDIEEWLESEAKE